MIKLATMLALAIMLCSCGKPAVTKADMEGCLMSSHGPSGGSGVTFQTERRCSCQDKLDHTRGDAS